MLLLCAGFNFYGSSVCFCLRVKVAEYAYLLFCEKAPFAALYVFLGEAGVHNPVQAAYIITEKFKHTAHDAVAAAVYFNADNRFILSICVS